MKITLEILNLCVIFQICSFIVFFEKHLDFLTSVPQRRMQGIILASCAKGNSGKMTDYAEVFPAHRTTYGHFLSKGKWDDEKVA